jgi:para-nitrobenzyl esterase
MMRFLNAGGARQSEDCLYLNVWTPGLDGAKRPVLVWIHGGAFLIGAGSTPIYRGQALARRGDLVVVTINYRLGALGFLRLNGLDGEGLEGASNAGLRDQIAALQWIRDNIEHFGGDPGNVTVCGQSAGAMSVAALLGAPRARALFARAICQSGAAENVMSPQAADAVAEAFLSALGGPARTRDALGRIPVQQILKAQGVTNRRMANLENLMVFAPCVDGDLIPEQPIEAIRRGDTKHLSLMVGTTLDEWKLFAALDSRIRSPRGNVLVERMCHLLPRVTSRAPDPPLAAWQYREAVRARGGRTSAFEVWSAFQSARVFHYPASLLAEAQARARGTVYSYLFTWRPPALRHTLGAFHALDVPFVFGLTNHPISRSLSGLASSANRLSHCMQDAWAAFAHTGDPGHGELPDWETYGAPSRATMVFGRQSYLTDAPLEPERALWERWI